ncbi:putative xyl repressor [Roseibium sp. TrichSKD4]|uniref:ROK family transcriptional regulator n=1 Tax=Roseibium sp. TrichSKD4 TaxID=744980 RepID=UPI0001E567BF|nr:ROK family transcriptional regulator [Roseibium sp. TrichSKD4]EFO31254.1 putative xyl repressor [Roseibium sp. TrichSKD4]
MPDKADRDQIRRQNRSIILQALRRDGPLARIELGQITGLSPATVTSITADLLDQELIEGFESTEAKEQTSRGRPRSLLKLKSGAAFVVCIRLSIQRLELSLVDYSGEIAGELNADFDDGELTSDTTARVLIDLVADLLTRAKVTTSAVREIGLVAQGAVEVETGTIIWSPAIEGRNTAIVEPLQRVFSANCHVSNDTNMITEALHWSDPERYGNTFVVLLLDYGVGMGLFLDGKLFSGMNGKAAEFGHSNHAPDGAICLCGKKGCYEAYLSRSALSQVAPPDPNCEVSRFQAAIDMAAEGKAEALAHFRQAGHVLGFGLARIIALIDPARIVLTGSSTKAMPFMEDGLKAGLASGLIDDLNQNYEIDVAPWDQNYIMRGMAAQAMRRLDLDFKGPGK